MNPFARVEHICARFVEDAFARIFPSNLEPAQVGRKLVAVLQATAGDLYLVRVHPTDYARFAADRTYLEARWTALLRDVPGAGRDGVLPRALLHEDPRVVAGSVTIESVQARETPAYLLQRPGAPGVPLRAGLQLGRAGDNDIVLADARVSRHHARISADASGFAVEDLGSSNGTFVDGRRTQREHLRAGSTLTLGDTNLLVRVDGG